MFNRDRNRGLSLVELVATVALLALLATFAIPGVGAWANAERHQALINSYNGLFSYARWMAASNRHRVTVCPLSPAGECVDDWDLPVHVFPDRDSNQKPDAGMIWRTLESPPSGFSTRSRTAGRGYFRFSAQGISHGSMGSLVVCSSATAPRAKMSYLAINMGGRFRALHDKDGDRRIKLPWGAVIKC
ncbi:GspH/FimT family protein [Marinobacter sp.]|uniref:GspH/FimT family protein n=1 Tax=Marinobacter sp. TaxID=50741 RepID=UPI00384E6473